MDDSDVETSTMSPRVVRPAPWVFILVALAAPVLLTLDARDLEQGGDLSTKDLAALVGLLLVVLLAGAAAARHRIEADEDSVTVRRLIRSLVLPRSDVRHVVPSRGRGAPAAIVLRSRAATEGTTLDRSHRSIDASHLEAIPLPELLGARRTARALGVECRPNPRRVGAMVRAARAPLDKGPPAHTMEVLDLAAADLTAGTGVDVAAARDAEGVTSRVGLAVAEFSVFVAVYQRRMFHREWTQVRDVAEATRMVQAELDGEASALRAS